MKEDLLQFIWQKQLFRAELCTLEGQKIKILHPGQLNRFSGPDFSNARLKIDNVLWAGNVEIHINESDWFKHHHDEDPAYRNIILHVVCQKEIAYSSTGHATCNLYDHIDMSLIENYDRLMGSARHLACSGHIGQMRWTKRSLWMEAMGLERFKLKVEQYQKLLMKTQYDFDKLLMDLIFKSFGFSSNKFAFEQLADRLQPGFFIRLSEQPEKVFLFLKGMASFELEHNEKIDFELLMNRFKVQPIEERSWKRGAVRPANSPILRMRQLADLLCRFKDIQQALHTKLEPKLLMQSVFKPNPNFKTSMGRGSKEIIVVNALAPYSFIVGDYRNDQSLRDYAIELLDEMKAEKNRYTRLFASEGLKARNALDSQAMIHLYREYCRPKKCLNCAIGNDLILNHDRKDKRIF